MKLYIEGLEKIGLDNIRYCNSWFLELDFRKNNINSVLNDFQKQNIKINKIFQVNRGIENKMKLLYSR